jgi:hypothetical protein
MERYPPACSLILDGRSGGRRREGRGEGGSEGSTLLPGLLRPESNRPFRLTCRTFLSRLRVYEQTHMHTQSTIASEHEKKICTIPPPSHLDPASNASDRLIVLDHGLLLQSPLRIASALNRLRGKGREIEDLDGKAEELASFGRGMA